jgi:hypothetical protein
VKLDRRRLEQVSGARLADDGVEELKELLTIYAERSADLRTQSFWKPEDITPVQKQEPTALQALVEAVWRVWQEHGGKGHGGRWDADPLVQGPFIRLMQELFHQAGLKQPSPRTLRRALQSIREEDARLQREAAWVSDPDNVIFVRRKRT